MSIDAKTLEKAQDLISELPLSLREQILEHIPIKQAVRTSILSTKWRYCWNGISSLIFDETFNESMNPLLQNEFTKTVNTSITCHRGCLSKFLLHIPFNVEVNSLEIDDWLRVLSRKGVREVTINCYDEDGDRFTLPSHFYNCVTLIHLSLEGAVLKPPLNFSGFRNLVTLELKGALMCSQVIGSIISKCPQLKRLTLAFARVSDHQQRLGIDAPKIVTLNLYESVAGNILLENISSLITVTIMSSECMALQFSNSYCPIRLLESLSAVTHLAFDFQFLEGLRGTCPESLNKKLTGLASLTLEWIDLWKPEDLHYLFCFLRSSPNLETLILRIYTDDEQMKNHSLQYLFKQVTDQSNLSNVLKIRFEGCKGFKHEIVVMKIILARCPHLESFHIEFDRNIDRAAAKKMCTSVMQFDRLSNGVKFVYSSSD